MPRNSLTERLDRLEDRVWSRYPELAPPTDPRRREYAERRLCETISRRCVIELVKGMELYSAAWRGKVDAPRSGPVNLYLAYHWVLRRGLQFGAPLDLSDRVAEIYLADPEARPADVCRECRYAAPASLQRRYFEQCPLCEGELRLHPRFSASSKREQS